MSSARPTRRDKVKENLTLSQPVHEAQTQLRPAAQQLNEVLQGENNETLLLLCVRDPLIVDHES